MIKSAMIRARMDPQLKEEAESILQELGLTTTQALTLFYQQIRMKRALPFAVQLSESRPAPSPTLLREDGTFPDNPNRATMKQNAEAFQAMHGDLVKRYSGQFVAICDARLMDHDPDPVALLQRMRATYPGQVILRRKVESVPEREIQVRHPQIEPL